MRLVYIHVPNKFSLNSKLKFIFHLCILQLTVHKKLDTFKTDNHTTAKCNELLEKPSPALAQIRSLLFKLAGFPPSFSTFYTGKTRTYGVINFLALICSELIRNRPCQLKRLEWNKITIRREDFKTYTGTNAPDLLNIRLDDAQIGDILCDFGLL